VIGAFTEDESVAWPSYVDFLSSFAIIMILFAGYMAFLLSNGVRDTAFMADVDKVSAIKGATPDWDRREIQVNLSDVLTYDRGCPLRKDGCLEMDPQQQENLREIGRQIGEYYPHSSRISVQGRADKEQGKDPYRNMEVAGSRAMEVFKILKECKTCAPEFRSKLEIANVGDTRAYGIGPEYRTVFIILDYSDANE